MSSKDLRDRVKDYVDTADLRLLKMIVALAETYQYDEEEYSLSEEQYQILDERKEAHYTGKSKSLSWEEVKQNAGRKAGL